MKQAEKQSVPPNSVRKRVLRGLGATALGPVVTMFVQVVAVTLLPAALMFLVLLLNDKPLMGDHTNTVWQNVANWSIIAFVIIMSSMFGVSVLFPGLFGQA